MKRKVVIKDSQSNGKQEYLTEAVTFGELVSELSLKVKGKRVVVRETKATLQLEDAVLPEGGFSLFIMPEKTKAGSLEFPDTTNWSDLGHNDLRRACKERNLTAVHVSSDEMRASLQEYVAAAGNPQVDVVQAIGNVIDSLTEIRENVKNISPAAIAEVVEVPLEELEADLAKVQASLNL